MPYSRGWSLVIHGANATLSSSRERELRDLSEAARNRRYKIRSKSAHNLQRSNTVAEMQRSISGWKIRPVYTRVAIVGLNLIALASFVFIILTLIDGDPITLGFFVFSMLLSVIFAGLMWRFGSLALLLAALWGILNLSWGGLLIPSRSYPNSFFDFVLPLLLTVGGLLTVVGAIVAFVQLRRGTVRRGSTRAERRAFGAIAVALVALVILSGTQHIAGITALSSQAEAGAIMVELRNDYLVPGRLEIAVGETARIVVKNNDFFVHTFEIEELGVKHTVLPFSEILIELRPTNTGEFTVRSEAPMTGDMEGTLIVTQ